MKAVKEAVGLEVHRNPTTGQKQYSGLLFVGEDIERATQIVSALNGLTIQEAQDLLGRISTYLFQTIFTPEI